MSKVRKGAVLAALVGLFALGTGGMAAAVVADLPGGGTASSATGGGLEAAAIGQMGDTTVTPPLTDILDLPALNIQEDAEGRIVMDLPALKLVSPPRPQAVTPTPTPAPTAPPTDPTRPDRLPVTGINVGDMLALGMAALSGGGLMLRRIRLSLAA